MKTQGIETQKETLPIELLQEGASIIKMENQTQMMIAVQRPRDEGKILSESLKELDLYPSMAREAIYTKPVGKDEAGKMKSAEGLSIRAAESLGNRWSNSSYGTCIITEDEESIKIGSVFLDYEKNTRHVRERRVSKFYKARTGNVVRHSPDRLDTVVAANSSKDLREVILRSLPAGLKKEYENKARNILKKEPIANQRNALLERFLDIGINQEQLEKWKNKPMKDWIKDDIIDSLGLANAIKDGEVNIEDVFEIKKNGEQPEGLIPGLKVRA